MPLSFGSDPAFPSKRQIRTGDVFEINRTSSVTKLPETMVALSQPFIDPTDDRLKLWALSVMRGGIPAFPNAPQPHPETFFTDDTPRPEPELITLDDELYVDPVASAQRASWLLGALLLLTIIMALFWYIAAT